MSNSNDVSDVLYHYCSMESLFGILNSMTLRLTNIRYMNDSKEYSWISELAKKVVWQLRHSRRADQEKKLCDVLLEHFDNLTMDETFFPEFYCACFSTAPDSLSQWRAYANDGTGVAIGFNREWLNLFVKGHVTRLAKVDYLDESDTVLATHREEVEQGFKELRNLERTPLPDEISIIARKVEDPWDSRAPFCKNAAFKEEEEVRLVHMPNLNEHKIGPTEFYHRQTVIVPYIALKLDLDSKPISKIVLGPRNRVEHNRRAITLLATNHGIRLARDQFFVSNASYGELRRIEPFRVPPGYLSR